MKLPALAPKEAVVALAGTEIDAGTASAVALETSEITPADCAFAERVTVQFVAVFGERLNTAHATDEIVRAGVAGGVAGGGVAEGGVSEIDVWAEDVLYVAVIVAV